MVEDIKKKLALKKEKQHYLKSLTILEKIELQNVSIEHLTH